MRYWLFMAVLFCCVAALEAIADGKTAALELLFGSEAVEASVDQQAEVQDPGSGQRTLSPDEITQIVNAEMARRMAATADARANAPWIADDFHGYPCTEDCSGHEAGYAWAEENGIGHSDDCDGNSQSFIEGCEAYAEEQEEADSYDEY